MPYDIYDPDFLTGLKDTTKEAKPDASTRTTGEALLDIGSKAVEPLFGLVRAGTTAARETFPASEWAQAADEDAKRWQHNLRENLTPYQKAIDTSSYFPEEGQRSAWRNPVSKLASDAAGFLVPAMAGAATGGIGAAAGLTGGALAGAAATGTGALFAAQGAGEQMAQQYDYAMDTPLAELNKSPVFQKAWIDWDGNEQAARQQFYKETRDIAAALVAGGAQGLAYGTVARLFPPARQEAASFVGRLLAGRSGNAAYRGLQGLTESAVAAPVMGGTAAYAEQSQKVNAGLQPNVDPHAMATGTTQAFESMAPFLTGSHVFRGRHLQKPGEQYGPPNQYGPWQPLDSDLQGVLGGQLAVDTGPPPGFGPGQPHSPATPPVPDTGVGGPQRAPTAPLAPHFPDIEQPGMPGEGDFPYEPEQAVPPPPAPGPPGPTPPGPVAAGGPSPPPPPAGPSGGPPAPAPTAVQTGPPPIPTAPVSPPPDRVATPPPPASSAVAAPAGPAPAEATVHAAPAGPVPSPVARTEPAAGPAPPRAGAQLLGKNQAGEDIWGMPNGHRIVVNPDGTTQETMGRKEGEGGGVIDRLKTAEEVAAGTEVPSPIIPKSDAELAQEKTVSDKLKQRAAEIAAEKAAPAVPEGFSTAVQVLDKMSPEDRHEAELLFNMGAHRGNASTIDARRLQTLLEKYGVGMPVELPPQGGGEAAVTPGVTEFPNVQRERARAEPRGETAIVPGAETGPALIKQGAAQPGVTLGSTLSPDQQSHMAAIRQAAEQAQARGSTAQGQAALDRQAGAGPASGPATKLGPQTLPKTETRTGKYKTGMERALEVAIKAWHATTTKTVDAWTALRKQALRVETARRDAGLRVKNYLSQIGPNPEIETPVAPYQKGFKREAPRGEEREATPAERTLANRIEALRQDLRDRQRTLPVPEQPPDQYYTIAEREADPTLKNTGIYETRGSPPVHVVGAFRSIGLPPEPKRVTERGLRQRDIFNRRRANLMVEARRLDAERQAEGLAPMFERAVPRESEMARDLPLEQQFQDQVARLELQRDLPTKQFVNSHVVRDALERMEAIEQARRAASAQGEHNPLHAPNWVNEKFAGHIPHFGEERLLVPNEPYVQASQRAYERRHGQVLARRENVSRTEEMKRRVESESTVGTQKHDVGTIFGETVAHSPESTAAFEARMAKLREAKAVGTPVGDYLRRLADKEQRKLTKEELQQVAREKLNQERAAGKKREYLNELPTEEDLDRIAAEAHDEQGRITNISEATGSVRERHTALRDQAIKDVIDDELKQNFGEAGADPREALTDLVDRLQIGLPPTPPDVPAKSKGQLRREARVIARAGKPEMPKELISRPRRGSPLTAAAINKSVLERLMEIATGRKSEPVRRTLEERAEREKRLGMTQAEEDIAADVADLPRNVGESHQKIRENYEKAIENWQARVLNQIVAGYELKPMLDHLIEVAKKYTERVKETIQWTDRHGNVRTGIKGQTIATWIPNGSRQKTADGHDYMKFTAGHAEEKAEHFNMLADLMNVAEQIRIAQIYAPEVKDFDNLKPDDARHIITRLVPQLTKLGGDLRAYEQGKIAMLNEARKAKTADITETKKGISKDQQKPGETDEAGEMKPSIGEQTDQAPSAEEQMIAREEADEPSEPTLPESEYQRRARERREKLADENLTAAQRPSTQVKGESVLGKRGSGAFAKMKATEDQPPVTRELSPEDKAARIKELEDRYGTTISKNRRNRPTDAPPPETAGEHLQEVQSAREALATDEPHHPLISDHEPASESIDRAKAILERGEGGDVSDFITPEFLDKLSKVNEGTQVLHAPVEVVAGKNDEGQAFYQPNKDRIVLSNNVSSGDYLKNVVHEHVHAATEHLLNTDEAFRNEVDDLRATAQRHAERAGVTNQRLLYGLRDPHEFLSESQSNPEFRALLARAAAPGRQVIHGIKSVLNALYHSIRQAWRRAVGDKDADTALDVLFRDTSSVLGATDRLVAKTLDRLEMEGRGTMSGERDIRRSSPGDIEGGQFRVRMAKTYNERAKTNDRLAEQYQQMAERSMASRRRAGYPQVVGAYARSLLAAAERYRQDAAEARAERDKFLSGERRFRPSAGEIAKGTVDKARDLYAAAAQGKFDLGMSLQTTMDLTHRGVQAFRDLTTPVAKLAARITTARQDIITKEDQPKLMAVADWLKKLDKGTRRKVEQFLHDESMHGAYADVSLTDPKNKHISLDDPYNPKGVKRANLSDAQVHRMHREMMLRYDDLKSIQGFEENRDALHKFFADRENDIRDAASRALIEHLNVLPESADTPEKKAAVIDLLQKHLFQGKLSKDERTQLEAIKNEAGRKVFKDLIARIRRTPELTKIAGPYIPLTRRGNWAVFGKFKIPEGGINGEMPVPERDRNGREIDDGTRMFDTREQAEDFERRMHDKYGISQLDGGEWFIDKSTGKRAREYTEEELHAMQSDDPDVRNRLLKAGEIPGRTIDFEGGQYEHKYWVKMQPKLLEFHNSRSGADNSAAAWRAKHGDDILVTNAEPVHRGAGKENEKYASAQMQKLINRFEQSESYKLLNDDQKAAVKSALTLQSAKLNLRRGIRQSFKAREYVAGVDPENLMANAADYSGQTAGYLANTRHYTEMEAAKKALDDWMASDEQRYQKEKVSTLHVRARDELYRKINDPAESPAATPFSKAVDFTLKWSMFNRLAGMSYYIINGTEPINLGAPMMMDRHGLGTGRSVLMEMNRSYRLINPFKMTWLGVKDAGKALMGKAEKFDADGNPTVYTDYAKLFKDAIDKQPDKEGLDDFLKQAGKLGLFETSASVEYQRMLKGGPSITGNKMDKVMDYGTNVFQGANTAVENLNRFVTGITAYRLEMKRTNDHQAAVEYATDIMYRTNGDYRDWNTPSLFGKGPVAKLAFQYHKYPQRVYVGYVEGAVGSLGVLQKLAKGETPDPEDMAKARRLMGLMAMQVGFAGVLGLPTEILKAPLNAAYLVGLSDMTGEDAENEFRAWVQGPEGSLAGQVLSDGFSRLTPVDVASKFSINFGPYGSPQSRKMNDFMASALRVVMGSGGQMADEARRGFALMVKGLGQLKEGATDAGWANITKAGRLLAPVKAAADLIATVQGGEPQKTASGKTIRPQMTAGQRVITGFGFKPTDIALGQESYQRVKSRADSYTAERSQLTNDWVQAPPSQRAGIQRSIDAFNKRYPGTDQRIQMSELLKSANAYSKAQATPPSQMGLPLTKRTLPFLQTEPNYGAAR